MVDINLLGDTKDPDGKQGEKPKPRPRFELSSPGRERREDDTGRPPSGFSVWLKKLFSGTKVPSEPAFKPERRPKEKASGRLITPPEVVAPPDDISAPPARPAPASGGTGSVPPLLPTRPGRRAAPSEPTPPPLGGSEGFLVNLLPAEYAVSPVEVRQRLIALGFVALGSLVLVLLVYFFLAFFQANYVNRTAEVQNDVTLVQGEIAQLRAQQTEALAFAARVRLLEQTLDRHIYWSNFFEKLETYTVKSVAFSNAFRGQVGASMTLDGLAASIEDVAHQLVVLQEVAGDFVTDAQLESVDRSTATTATGTDIPLDAYSFSMNITLVDELFTREEAG
ncbi:MAG: hypothetical protein HYZ09_02860 [Candidatus Kerfeldbacteria bacterium]|nr:hypothetical protein [Candidatus Kerfeldbacteria bacterium]